MAWDIATRCGWAISSRAGPPLFGTQRIGKPHYEDGRFFSAFRRWAAEMIELERPRALYYEAPIITDSETSMQTAFRLLGMAAHAEAIAYEMRVPHVGRLMNSSIRKHFTGKGRWGSREEGKRKTVEACQARGWMVGDDNAADALAALDLAAHLRKEGPLNAGGLFAGQAA